MLVARGQDSDETGSRRSRHSIGGMGESLWCLQVAETCKAWPDAGRKRSWPECRVAFALKSRRRGTPRRMQRRIAMPGLAVAKLVVSYRPIRLTPVHAITRCDLDLGTLLSKVAGTISSRDLVNM